MAKPKRIYICNTTPGGRTRTRPAAEAPDPQPKPTNPTRSRSRRPAAQRAFHPPQPPEAQRPHRRGGRGERREGARRAKRASEGAAARQGAGAAAKQGAGARQGAGAGADARGRSVLEIPYLLRQGAEGRPKGGAKHGTPEAPDPKGGAQKKQKKTQRKLVKELRRLFYPLDNTRPD